MKFVLHLALSFSSSLLIVAPVLAADAPAAPAKAALCASCHGAGGLQPIMGLYPKIGGQNKEYLVSSLKAYKLGQRTGGMAPVMASQTQTLTDADIDLLADYFSKQ